jgi:hypothetical protein
MSKSSVYRKSGLSLLAKILIIAFCVFCAIVVVVFVGKNYASGFGFADSASTPEQNQEESVLEVFDESGNQGVEVFKDEESRDVNILVSEIKAEEEEKKRIEAEEKKKRDQVCIDRGVKNKEDAGNPDDGVDFTVGRDEFVQLWGARIDTYLAGSPLAGQGKTFAEAAFENGIDPRVSPAISNTESGKGAVCFRPHNAWGWMGSAGWDNWEEAIAAHVKGFADGYGYTVTEAGAKKYCPPTWESWYSKTTAQMALI